MKVLAVLLVALVGTAWCKAAAKPEAQPVGDEVATPDDAVEPEENIFGCNAIQKRLCRNGSKCVKTGLFRFKCVCEEGTSGRFCQTVDPCFGDEEKCANGGECERVSNTLYRCNCSPKWTGPRCEQVNRYECESNDPCTEENIFYDENEVTIYYAHTDVSKFIQCDPYVHENNCYEFDCPPGLVFNNVLNVCDWP